MKSAASLTASLLARKGDALPTEGTRPIDAEGHIAVMPATDTPSENIQPAPPSQRPVGPVAKRPVGAGRRVAMTVRLDHEQHLRLRVFSAYQRRSSQEILATALDKYIEENAPSNLDTACISLKS